MILKKTFAKINSSGYHLFQPFLDKSLDIWIKLGVILLVFSASIIFGYKSSPEWAFLAVLLIGGFFGFLLFLRHPQIGIFLLVPLSFFAPWEVGTGTSATLNLTFLFSIAIIGIWIFSVITNREKIYPQATSVNILSILFLVSICISFLGGNIHWVINAQNQASITAQVGGWLIYILSISIMFYVQTHIKDIRGLKILTWIFIGFSSLNIIEYFSPIKFNSLFHSFSSGSIGSMYWVWLISLTFGQFIFNKELHLRYRLALGFLTIAILMVGLSPNNREWTSGWLPSLVTIGTILWLRSWRLGLAATLVAFAVFGILNADIFYSSVVSTNQYSITTRFATYPILFELIKANPIIGLGFANYSHYTYLYPIMGYFVSFNSHNNYMDIIAQTGFVGLVLFFCMMIAIGMRGWKLHKLDVDGFSSGYINACLGGMVGLLVSGMLGDWFLPYLYNIGIPGFRASIFSWIFLGGLLALGRILGTQEKEIPTKALVNPSI